MALKSVLSLCALAFSLKVVTGACTTSSTASPSSTPLNLPFTITAARSGSPIHLQQVQACNERFFIGEGPCTYCPEEVDECPPDSETVIVSSGGAAVLDVEVPGGQLMYVTKEGALGYTQAHSELVPNGATTLGFNYTPGVSSTSLGEFGFVGFNSSGWAACPTTSSGFPYQILAGKFGNSSCLGFDALTYEYTGGLAAWQYT